jgi:type IV pilus assembly protein PilA
MFTRFNKALNDRRAGIKREEGFTLIELLVVVIIIGILAAIAVPIYIGVQNNAKDSGVKSDLTNAKVAVVAYYTDKNAYPTALTVDLSTYGYTAPASGKGNYGTTGSIPFIFFNATDTTKFCVGAKSVTGKNFGSTATGGVEEGVCATGGVFTPAS